MVLATVLATDTIDRYRKENQLANQEYYGKITAAIKNSEVQLTKQKIERIAGQPMLTTLLYDTNNPGERKIIFVPSNSVSTYLQSSYRDKFTEQHVYAMDTTKWSINSITFNGYTVETDENDQDHLINSYMIQRDRFDLTSDADDFYVYTIQPEEKYVNYSILAIENPESEDITIFNPIINKSDDQENTDEDVDATIS